MAKWGRRFTEQEVQCQGKFPYLTMSMAREQAELQSRKRKAKIEPYRCNICGKFHIGNKSPAPSKMRNQFTTVDGIRFHSKREATRYKDLLLLERGGAIRDLKLQPRYPIVIGGVDVRYLSGRPLEYVADFEYVDCRSGEVVIEDAKGAKTYAYKVKQALMRAMGKTIKEI